MSTPRRVHAVSVPAQGICSILLLASTLAVQAEPQTTTPTQTRQTRALYAPELATLTIENLPHLLAIDSVRTNLESGLSTVVIATVSFRDGNRKLQKVHARARIRFDLWDEIFLIDSLGFQGEARHTVGSLEELLTWWRDLEIAVSDNERRRSPAPSSVRLRLVVLPFSESEESDARLWFSQSARRAGTRTPGDGSSPLSTFLEQMMAGSIKRDELASLDLKLGVEFTSDTGDKP